MEERMTLEEARARYVGQPYNYENEKALSDAGYMPLLYGSKISIVQPIRRCKKFQDIKY